MIRIWDLRAKRHQREYACTAGVTSVALHPNQMELVSGDQVRVERKRERERERERRPLVSSPRPHVFSPHSCIFFMVKSSGV